MKAAQGIGHELGHVWRHGIDQESQDAAKHLGTDRPDSLVNRDQATRLNGLGIFLLHELILGRFDFQDASVLRVFEFSEETHSATGREDVFEKLLIEPDSS